MKKLYLLTLCALLFTAAGAQQRKIEDAKISLNRDGDVAAAKEAIDAAAANPSTSNAPEMWKVKGEVYLRIANDSNFSKLDAEAADVAINSFINCIELEKNEKKKRYTPEAYDGMVQASIPAYYRALYYYDQANYKRAIEYWGYIIKAIGNDPDNKIKKYNINKPNLIQLCADAALKNKDNAAAKNFLSQLIDDPDYKGYTVFIQLAYIYMEELDTNGALKYIEIGRKRFPEEKNLFGLELNIYTQRGQTDILMEKLNKALEAEPDNLIYLFNRGALRNDKATKLVDNAKEMDDSASEYRSKVKRATKPADKTKFKGLQAGFEKSRDSIFVESNKYFDMANEDYQHILKLDPVYFDALFNLGALNFNKATEFVTRHNYMEPSEANYEAKIKELKGKMDEQFNTALEYFLKAYEVKPDDVATLRSLQQTYAQLGNKEKSDEYRQKREEAELNSNK